MNKQTVEMLGRLQRAGIHYDDAWALRHIAMTLHRWFELECGDSDNYKSWAIERDGDEPDSPPFMVYHCHDGNYGWSVWCREDRKPDGSPGDMVRATRRTFSTKDAALAYLQGISPSREPEIRQVFTRRERVADRETGARKRLAKIVAKYPGFTAYVQTDPRGAPLWILRPGDVKDGNPSCSYTNGLPVYK